MGHEPQIGAIFADRARAESAVDDLRRSGLADEHLGVAVHGPERFVFEREAESEVAHGLERGAALGAPLGAVAGMTLLALVVPGIGALGVGGILAAGAATGALTGGFWGAYLGITSEKHVLEDEWDWERAELSPGEVLVVVDQHGRPDDVRSIFERHQGRLVEKPEHIG